MNDPKGKWIGIPPTGLPVKMRFSDFWLKDGLLSENWVMTDDYGVLIQLGIDPLARIDKTLEITIERR